MSRLTRMDTIRDYRQRVDTARQASRDTVFQPVAKEVRARRINTVQTKDPLVAAFQKDLRLVLAGRKVPNGTLGEIGPQGVDPLERIQMMARQLEAEMGPKLRFLDETKGKRLDHMTPEQWAIVKDKGYRSRATAYFKATVEEVAKVNGAYANLIAEEMPSLKKSYIDSLTFFHQKGLNEIKGKRDLLAEKYREARARGDKQAVAKLKQLGQALPWAPVTMNKEAIGLALEGKYAESVMVNKVAGVVQGGKTGAFGPLLKQLSNLRKPTVGARYQEKKEWTPPRTDEDFLSVKLGPGDKTVVTTSNRGERGNPLRLPSVRKEEPLAVSKYETQELEQIVQQNPGAREEAKELRKREQGIEDSASFRRQRLPVVKDEALGGVLRSERGRGLLAGVAPVTERNAGEVMSRLAAMNAFKEGVAIEEMAIKAGQKQVAPGLLAGNKMLLGLMGEKGVKDLVRAGGKIPTKGLPKRVRTILRILDLGE
jgi:hypothetical protein